jgi:hypothetical protein
MATVTIKYKLSETGRKAHLLAGGNGKQAQSVEVTLTPELLAIADVDTEGRASITVGQFAGSYTASNDHVYREPILEFDAIAPSDAGQWVLDVHRAAEESRQQAVQAAREWTEAQKAERAAKTAEWRALAARYIAGDPEVSCTNSYYGTLCGIGPALSATDTDATESERRPVDVECERREAAAKAAKNAEFARGQAETAAKAASVLAARRALLVTVGAPAHALERLDAGVLPEAELLSTVRDYVLPETLTGVQVYQPHDRDDIDHASGCNYGGDCNIMWSVHPGDGDPLTAEEWGNLKAVRAAAELIPGAKVDVREHRATLACDCPNQNWYTARVQVTYPDADLTVQRQYAL